MCFNVQMYSWPHLSIDVTMHVDIHRYDTRSVENMDLYIPRRFIKEVFCIRP